ncbi:tRNA-guanine(15) transglycosylase-like protein [Halteromyces radiatus]|uniref:tRNA-guanine(15) transglycosylase-like protein n=1 Tax=Halteromyces radiatus TaxID=101107 RepID=UPI00221E5402|nr:tRNA-guanine(15) transglycosylase-like protein [Halteromyces radiatus]KAI8099081.1 tRNA-guanine(15) transglycosylase-like protein [Halteromyces radiatus]
MQRMASLLTFTTLNESTTAAKLYPRRGALNLVKKNKTIQTPACLTYTIRGAVPHLIVDNLSGLPIDMCHLSLEHFLEEKEPSSLKYPYGIHKYTHLENHLVFCDMRDPQNDHPVTFNTDKYLSVDTHGGVRQVTPELWSKVLETYQPDIYAAMADIICDKDAKMKRVKRSVDRTLRWLDQCLPKAKELGTPIFAPVMGHTSVEERQRSSKETMERDVEGFTVSVLGLKKDDFTSLLQASLEPLPVNKPKLAYGLTSPEHILMGVANGVDLFDGSYAYTMTERGRAISINFGENLTKMDGKVDKTINMWDTKLAQTFEPLDPTCGCYSCTTPHTKAYIHHLLNAHEMLATILLMGHNIYQLGQFMESIRKSIDGNRFQQDMQSFMEKYNHAKEVDGEQGHVDELDAESLGVAIKKKRTLLL